MSTKQNVISSIEQLSEEYELFVNGNYVLPRAQFDRAYENVFDTLDEDECYLLPEFHAVALAASWLAREMIKHRKRVEDREAEGSRRPVLFESEFFERLVRLFSACDTLENPEPIPSEETVQELAAQGVSHNQIGRMYRIRPDQVRDELASPGSVIKPDHVTQNMLDREEGLKRQKAELRIIRKERDTLHLLRLEEDRMQNCETA